MQITRLLAQRLLATTGFFAVLALGAVIGAFALRSMGSSETLPPVSLLATSSSAAEASVIPGLPEYPGATRSEFREETFGDERVTEIEYVVDSSVPDVRDHYSDALARGGWTVTDTTWIYGEWVYSVSSGARRGVVEIEHRNGVTEVEVEIAEPLALRSGLTDG